MSSTEEKKCSKCKIVQSLDSFYTKKRSKARADGSIHSWTGHYAACKECTDLYNNQKRPQYKDWYKNYREQNKDKSSEKGKAHYKKVKQDWWDILATLVKLECSKCGYNSHSAGLDFHHVDPSTKETTIHALLSGPQPNEDNIAALKKEVDKCIVLCATCHREEHAKYNFLKK